MVENDECDIKLIFWILYNMVCVMKNLVSSEVVEIECCGGVQFEDVKYLVVGVCGCNVMEFGDLDGGIWLVGQVQGLIDDILMVKQLID